MSVDKIDNLNRESLRSVASNISVVNLISSSCSVYFEICVSSIQVLCGWEIPPLVLQAIATVMSLSSWILIIVPWEERVTKGVLMMISAAVQLLASLLKNGRTFYENVLGHFFMEFICSKFCGLEMSMDAEEKIECYGAVRLSMLSVVDFGFDLIAGLAFAQGIDHVTGEDSDDAGPFGAILLVGSALGATGQIYEFLEELVASLDKVSKRCSATPKGATICFFVQWVCGIVETVFMFILVCTTNQDQHPKFMIGSIVILIVMSFSGFIVPVWFAVYVSRL